MNFNKLKEKQAEIRKTPKKPLFIIKPGQKFESSFCSDGCCGVQVLCNNTNKNIETSPDGYYNYRYVQELFSK